MDVEKNPDQGEGQKEFLVSNVKGVFGAPLMIDNDRYIFRVIRKSTREGSSSADVDDSVEADEVEDVN